MKHTKNNSRKSIVATGLIVFPFLLSSSLLPFSKAYAQAQVTSVNKTTASTQSTQTPTDSDAMNLSAIPPRVEITAKPGDVIQKTLKIHNGSSSLQYLETTTADFIVGDDGKTPIPVNEKTSNKYSLSSWLTVSPTRFSIQANETQSVDLLIQVPSDALPGGHYAMVLYGVSQQGSLTQDLTKLKTNTSAGVSGKVGSLIYVTVAGNIHEEAFIRDVTAPRLVENGPFDIGFKVDNQSDVHIRPNSSIEVTDMLGRQIDTIVVNPENIFPSTIRPFTGRYDRVWGFGRYIARIIVPYGDQGKVVQALTSFWIIPYKLITTGAIFILALVAIAISIRRHLIFKKDVKTQEIELLKERIKDLEEKKASR